MIDKIMALYWDFWHIPYFKVFVTKDGKVIRVFNQKAVSNLKGSEIALIDTVNKLCWSNKGFYLSHKARMMVIVDIHNALPLIFESKYKYTELCGGLITKEIEIKKITVDKRKLQEMNKEQKRTGLSIEAKEVTLPVKEKNKVIEYKPYSPSLFFEELNAFFIQQTIQKPLSKWEELKWVLIAAILGGVFLIWQFIMSKGTTGVA